jgi:terminase small subunit-like protein
MSNALQRRTVLAQIKAKGGWDTIFDRIASGESIAALAREFGCSRPYISRLMNEHPQRREKLAEAKREGAAAHFELAQEVIETAKVTRDDLTRAKLLAEHHRAAARVGDPQQFGEPEDKHTTNILSLGALHLAALMRPADPEALQRRREELERQEQEAKRRKRLPVPKKAMEGEP